MCIVLYGPVENVEIFMLIGNLKLYTTKVFFYVDEKLKVSHHHRHTFKMANIRDGPHCVHKWSLNNELENAYIVMSFNPSDII